MKTTRRDCTPEAEIPTQFKRTRRYTGPTKGSQEAKDRMAKVRAAQWAKNGLIVSDEGANAAPLPAHRGALPQPGR